MKDILGFFATGKDKPLIQDEDKVNRLYKKYRLSVMLAISVGYGLAYTLRLALNMVKKPILDAGIFTPSDLGNIGSALLYTYAIGKFTNGFLADHANVKRFFSLFKHFPRIQNMMRIKSLLDSLHQLDYHRVQNHGNIFFPFVTDSMFTADGAAPGKNHLI